MRLYESYMVPANEINLQRGVLWTISNIYNEALCKLLKKNWQVPTKGQPQKSLLIHLKS